MKHRGRRGDGFHAETLAVLIITSSATMHRAQHTGRNATRAVKRLKRWRNSAVSLTVSFNKRNRKQFRLINETENHFVNRFVNYEMERNTKFRVFYTEILLTKWKIPFRFLHETEIRFVNRFVTTKWNETRSKRNSLTALIATIHYIHGLPDLCHAATADGRTARINNLGVLRTGSWSLGLNGKK
jgi:hypothetical protein